MAEKIVFPKNVEIGKFYSVPHVFANNWYAGIRNVYIPVSSPKHGDAEYIGVKELHYHVDWRFLNSRVYKRVCVEVSNPNFKVRAEVAYAFFEETSIGEKQIDSEIIYRDTLCKRGYSGWMLKDAFPNMFYKSWLPKMQKGYCGQHLRINEHGQYVCPHKGAIVDLKYTDEDGHAICPAHQLRFNTETLQAI